MIPRIFRLQPFAAAILAAAALFGVPPGGGTALAQSDVSPQKPTRHFRVERPAGLSGADALTIYNRILDDMVAGYRLSNLPHVDAYRNWRRFNTVPYRSAQHGERYVNNYGNEAARDYRYFEGGGDMPAGAVLFKDSFAVTKRGDVFSGPLFVMEKMQPGFNLSSEAWHASHGRPWQTGNLLSCMMVTPRSTRPWKTWQVVII